MNYCVVEADTARYYDELGRLDALDEQVNELIDELIDDVIYYGKAEYRSFSFFLDSYLYELVLEDIENGDELERLTLLFVNLLTGKGKDRDKVEAEQDVESYLKPKLETLFEGFKDDLTKLVEEQNEEDRYDV